MIEPSFVWYIRKGRKDFCCPFPYLVLEGREEDALNSFFKFRLWIKLLMKFKVSWVTPRYSADVFSLDFWEVGNIMGQKPWNSAVMAINWDLWLESSKRIFDNLEKDVDGGWDSVKPLSEFM